MALFTLYLIFYGKIHYYISFDPSKPGRTKYQPAKYSDHGPKLFGSWRSGPRTGGVNFISIFEFLTSEYILNVVKWTF